MAQLIISDQDVRKVITIGGTPTTGPHTFNFFYFDDDDINVYVDGVLQTKTTDYSVTPTTTNDDGFEGGTVTTVASLSNATLAIVLALPFAKDSNMPVNAAFDVATLNTTLSKMIAMLQVTREWQSRALTIPVDEESTVALPAAASRADGFLSFDSSGNPAVATAVVLAGTTTTAYGDTVINTASADTNLDLLGATTDGKAMLTAATPAAQLALIGGASLTLANTFTKTQTYTRNTAASAAALTLGDGNVFSITGAVTITSIATKGVGTVVYLEFVSTPLLTHNATNLILPGGADITAAAGDTAVFVEYGTGTWRCLSYQRVASAIAPATGAVISGWENLTPATAFGTETDITTAITAGYDYRMEWFDVDPSLDNIMQLQVYEAAVWKTSTGDYRSGRLSSTSSAGTGGDAWVNSSGLLDESTNDVSISIGLNYGHVEIRQPDHASIPTSSTYMHTIERGTLLYYNTGHSRRTAAAAATQFRLNLSAGTFNSSGYYAIYRKVNGN